MNDITLVGIDTGGTFTDIVVLERGPGTSSMRHCKVLSDPTDPSASGGDAFDLADLNRPDLTWIRYIKIESTGHRALRDDFGGDLVEHPDPAGSNSLSGAASSGFDLDAASATHY